MIRFRVRYVACFLVAAFVIASAPASRAQGPGAGGGTVYVPYGGNMSGFIPYSPGPSGGLGVQPGMGSMATPAARSVMPGAMAPSLGAVRSRLTPLAPLTSPDATMGRSGGLGLMGPGGSMVRRVPAAGGMGGMARPAVGSYPFRQPPSLVSPAAPSPGMSM
jgi:hypothetical protein